jgi:hypothetical protein
LDYPSRLLAYFTATADQTDRPNKGPPKRARAEIKVMTQALFARVFTVKSLIRVAFTVLSLNSIGIAHSQATRYHAPAQNYYQNNWMSDGR